MSASPSRQMDVTPETEPNDSPLLSLRGEEEDIIDVDLTQTISETFSPIHNFQQGALSNSQLAQVAVKRCKERKGAGSSSVFISHDHPTHRLAVKKDKDTDLYVDGNYSAASLKLHVNPTMIPILDTPDDGVLHIVTGWTREEILSDLCYRFEPRGRWYAKGCDFLDTSQEMLKRAYRCKGVMACPVLLDSKEDFDHCTEEEWTALQAFPASRQRNTDIMEMETARNLYVALTNPAIHFCPAIVKDGRDGIQAGSRPTRCSGRPALRQVRVSKEWFIGCSDYYLHKDVNRPHYFKSIRHFTPKARGYMKEMLEKGEPLIIPEDMCEYVVCKKGRGTKRCVKHGVDLVGAGTLTSAEGKCNAVMFIAQAITQGQAQNEKEIVTYVIAKGAHNHPPPPQADTTMRKKKLFRTIAGKAPATKAAVLKFETQQTLQEGSSSTMVNFNIGNNHMYNTLTEMRRPSQRQEYSSMFELMERGRMPYVRDAMFVREGVVFLLGTDDMICHGTDRMVFGDDATYKTVMETNPQHVTPNWYLYNIVTPYDATTATHKGVVVCRALMTSLTTDAYAAVWGMFLKSMRLEKEKRFGLNRGDVSIHVPYMTLEPEREKNCISVRAVTTDFEIAEVEGIAAAFAEQRGGSLATHKNHLLVGCRVHFERAYLKRANCLSHPAKDSFLEACRSLSTAATVQEADEHFAVIHDIDSNWGSWLSKSHVRPLTAPPYSGMRQIDRMIALQSTNIVESQNEKGHYICGTRLHPVLCTQKLFQLDKVSTTNLFPRDALLCQKVPRQKTRRGHTLAPAGAENRNRVGCQRGIGRKRKAENSAAKRSVKKGGVNGSDQKSGMEELAANPRRETDKVIPSDATTSLDWLHDELGARCQRAVGNEKLMVALSDLYKSVLESDDLNKVKYHILCTMKEQSADKEIVQEFTDLLVLASNPGVNGDDEVSHAKKENVVVQVEDNISKEGKAGDVPDVVHID